MLFVPGYGGANFCYFTGKGKAALLSFFNELYNEIVSLERIAFFDGGRKPEHPEETNKTST